MAQPDDAVRALKRLERAAREAARAIAQDRSGTKEWLRARLAEVGIELRDTTQSEEDTAE
jgi:hypothetical protein